MTNHTYNLRRLLLLGIVLVLVPSCGRIGRRAEPTPLPPVELNVVSFNARSWNDAEDVLVEQYQITQPNVTFDQTTYAQSPTAYLSHSPAPDMMVISPGYLLDKAVDSQQLLELTDVWEQSGLLEDYPLSLLALSAHDGKQFYLPIAYTWTAIYYNKDVFEEIGLEPPATWDEFIMVCDALVANGVTPLTVAGRDVFQSTLWFDYLNLRLNGLAFHRELTSGEISYEDTRVREVFELWGWMLERGYFVDRPDAMNASDSIMALGILSDEFAYKEQAAMTLAGPSSVDDIPAALRSGLGFFPFPIIGPTIPKAEALTAYGYMIPYDSANRESALSFVQFAASADAQSAMVPWLNTSAAGLAPANPNADASNLPEDVKRGAAIIGDAEGVTPFYVLAIPDVLWSPTERAITYFLQNPYDVDTTVMMLEEARQKAHSSGQYLPVD